MKNRRITGAVITGPTGALGTALCRELAEGGVTVYAVCHPNSHRAGELPKHNRIIRIDCDISELSRLPELIGGRAEVFYHLAWAHTIGPGRNDMTAQTDNIRYTLDAVRAAGALGCQVFIGAGSQAEYGRVSGALRPDTPCFPENGYGMAKLCAGQMSRVECGRLGLEHIWTRILSLYGPGDGQATMISGVIRQLLRGQRPPLTEGRQIWDYLYSGDAARAFALLGEKGKNGKTYILGSADARPLKEYLFDLRDAIDPGLELGFGEVPYGPGQVMHLEADITDLTRDTGFIPRTDFREGIRRTIDWIKEKETWTKEK